MRIRIKKCNLEAENLHPWHLAREIAVAKTRGIDPLAKCRIQEAERLLNLKKYRACKAQLLKIGDLPNPHHNPPKKIVV